MQRILPTLLLAMPLCTAAQSLYFPPSGSNTWETTDPATLGWCPDRIDSLYAYLDQHHTKAFIVLKDGKIVLEHYVGTFTQDSLWYWASAGKTLTSTIVGIAQEEGYLNILDPTSTYLGTGWTSATPAQEAQITVRNQLTMTSGLNDAGADPYCTDPSCLTYLADAGTRWAYHNAPYTLLDQVVAQATGQTFSQYFNAKLRNPIGMNGLWVQVDENNLYFSTARSMARFGLLALNQMVWAGDTILHDTAYFHAATTPSQNINLSYGYLWWLNGQPTYMLPQTQFVFQGPLMPDAPLDAYNALGKNDQLINVVPSQNLVLVRMGDAAEESLQVSTYFDNIIWQYMNALECNSGISLTAAPLEVLVSPNPARSKIHVSLPFGAVAFRTEVLNAMGQTVLPTTSTGDISIADLAPGMYLVKVTTAERQFISRLVKE
ncbi:MAG: serine hydrolase [Bacteroidetes bacterium]|nr:serine hydrolase [Bacteroidota bacterium]MBS1941376.1 serine hydrolase [Bacteroidota bacterium]